MVEKITINPTKVRAYGNIMNVKTDEDYELVDCTITEATDTINGVSMTVYLLEPDLGESTTLTVTSSSATLVLDGTVTISATLKDSSNVAISGATVTFKEGSTTLGTGTTNSSGVATYTYTGATTGSHTVSGVYGGDSTYASSTGSVSLTVNKKSTSTSLTTSSASVTVGTSVTFTATVTSGGSGVNGLTVTFKDGTTTLGTSTTNSSGIATYTISGLNAGNHSITAVVTENSTYAASTSSAVSLTVNNHSYSLAFSAASYVATGGSATLECTLLDNNVPVEGATISVSGSDSSLYSGITNSNGIATVTVTGLTATATFTCTYQNVSDTATVTVQTYIFYDDCSSSAGLSNYGSSVLVRGTNAVASIAYDTTNNCYVLTGTGQYHAEIPIPVLNDEDGFYLSADFICTYNSYNNSVGFAIKDYNNTSITSTACTIRGYSSGLALCGDFKVSSDQGYWVDNETLGKNTRQNWINIRIEINGQNLTVKYTDVATNTLLKTYTHTLASMSHPGVGLFLMCERGTTVSKCYVKNIKAEYI